MEIPVVGKLYFVPELNLCCIFRKICCTRNKKNIAVEFYKDEERKQRIYNFELRQTFERDLSGFTFQPVINKAEMRRRPFDFVDLDGAIALLITKKRFQNVYCTINLFSPVKFTSENYNWHTRTPVGHRY